MKPPFAGIDAIILADGVNRIPLFPGCRPGLKALLDFGGSPSLRYVAEALRDTPKVRRIALVGPEIELAPAVSGISRLEFVEGGASLLESISNGLRHFREEDLVLVTTADLPLLAPSLVDVFLRACSAACTDRRYADRLYLAMAPESSFTGPYAGKAKGFQRFRDVSVCHGNLALVTPRVMDNRRAMHRVNVIYRARKNALRTLLAFGPRLAFAYLVGAHLLGILSLDRMSRVASRRFDLDLVPVVLEAPELALDVDEPGDYRFVSERLEGRE